MSRMSLSAPTGPRRRHKSTWTIPPLPGATAVVAKPMLLTITWPTTRSRCEAVGVLATTVSPIRLPSSRMVTPPSASSSGWVGAALDDGRRQRSLAGRERQHRHRPAVDDRVRRAGDAPSIGGHRWVGGERPGRLLGAFQVGEVAHLHIPGNAVGTLVAEQLAEASREGDCHGQGAHAGGRQGDRRADGHGGPSLARLQRQPGSGDRSRRQASSRQHRPDPGGPLGPSSLGDAELARRRAGGPPAGHRGAGQHAHGDRNRTDSQYGQVDGDPRVQLSSSRHPQRRRR